MLPQRRLHAIWKLHSILAVANLLAHNNISQICYCGQISLQSAAVNCSFSDHLTPVGVPFLLLAMVPMAIILKVLVREILPDSLPCRAGRSGISPSPQMRV